MQESFRPSESWLSQWPWQEATIVRLLAECYGGQDARKATEDFMASLSYQSNDGVACRGGYCVKAVESDQPEVTSLEFYSSGEDGFSSLLFGLEDFEDFLGRRAEISEVKWRELAPQKSSIK